MIDRINHPNLGATRSFFELNDTRDEMGMSIVNFVAVYDDTQARDTLGTAGWTNPDTRNVVLSDWIDEQANRIHFNRYTGLAEVANR